MFCAVFSVVSQQMLPVPQDWFSVPAQTGAKKSQKIFEGQLALEEEHQVQQAVVLLQSKKKEYYYSEVISKVTFRSSYRVASGR